MLCHVIWTELSRSSSPATSSTEPRSLLKIFLSLTCLQVQCERLADCGKRRKPLRGSRAKMKVDQVSVSTVTGIIQPCSPQTTCWIAKPVDVDGRENRDLWHLVADLSMQLLEPDDGTLPLLSKDCKSEDMLPISSNIPRCFQDWLQSFPTFSTCFGSISTFPLWNPCVSSSVPISFGSRLAAMLPSYQSGRSVPEEAALTGGKTLPDIFQRYHAGIPE